MKIKELAEDIQVISLPARIDRRTTLEENWRTVGLEPGDYSFMDAIRPASDTILWNEMRCMEADGSVDNLRNNYVVGSVGCKRSWKKALTNFLASNKETVLICEDDCRFDYDTAKVMGKFTPFPEGWEMIHLGLRHTEKPRLVNAFWHRVVAARCMTAVIFNRASAQRLLSELGNCPFEIDVYVEKTHKKWKAYSPINVFARQAATKSDISIKQKFL